MSQRSTQRSEHSTAGAYVHPGEEFTRDTAARHGTAATPATARTHRRTLSAVDIC